MTLGLAYWVIVLVWTVFFLLVHFGVVAGAYSGAGTILFWVLFVILGWQLFGPPLHR
jgi:hypothetical protein